MAASTSLVFNIIGNNNASGAIGAVESSFSKLGSVVKTAGFAVAAAAAAGTVAVGAFAVSAVRSASDLNETMSKSSVIFGEQAAEISAWGDTAAKALGLSKNQAVGAAAGFGDMFRQLGFGGDQAAGMSKQIVGLAADLGSFNNLGTDEVLDMLSGAFRGEYDSLQRVIPNISASRVETEALAATGKKAAKDLTAQEKATATLAIVQADGARAAGDFARTSGGLANQQKILGAQFEDIKARVGTALLPVLTKLGSFAVNTLLPAFSKVGDVAAQVIGVLFNGDYSGGLGGEDSKIVEFLFRVRDAGVQVVGWLQANLIPALQTQVMWWRDKVLPILGNVAGFITSTVVPAVAAIAAFVLDKVVPAVRNLAETALSGLRDALDTIRGKIEENRPQLEKLWGWFKTIAGFVMDYVVPILGQYLKHELEVVGQTIGLVIDIIGRFVDVLTWLWNTGASVAQGIAGAFTTAKDWIAQRIEDVIGFITGMPSRIGSAAAGMFDGVKNAFRSAINWIVEKWNGLSFTIGGGSYDPLGKFGPTVTVPAFTFGTPDIPMLAKGGNVTAGGSAIVGERGPELLELNPGARVTPLTGVDGKRDTLVLRADDAWGQMVIDTLRKAIRERGGRGPGSVQFVLGS